MALLGKTRNTCRILVGKSFGRPKRRWKDAVKMDCRELDCEDGGG